MDVVYQPIINHRTRKVFGNELLSRPKFNGKSIPPDIWFHAASVQGHSADADLLALHLGLKDFKLLPQEFQHLPLFVNVLPTSLTDRTFFPRFIEILRENTCLPEQIVLEITEQVPYDPSGMEEVVTPLRALGIRLALDDLGTGSSNLEALVRLEPDFIKLDRSLIQGICSSPSQQRMATYLAEYMGSGSRVVAEGIESFDDLSAVQDTGVHLSQGYHWSKPVAAAEMSSLFIKTEIKRAELMEAVRRKRGLLTDKAVLKLSRELDTLILQLMRLNKGELRRLETHESS